MPKATYTAEEVAERCGVNSWAVYQAVRNREAPIGTMAVKVGRRLVWPKALLDRLLALDEPVAGS